MSLQRPSKTVPTLDDGFPDLKRIFVDDVDAPQTSAAEVHDAVDRQKRFVSVAKNPASVALDDIVDLSELVAASSRCETELLANTSVTLNQMARAAEEWR